MKRKPDWAPIIRQWGSITAIVLTWGWGVGQQFGDPMASQRANYYGFYETRRFCWGLPCDDFIDGDWSLC